MCKCSGYRSNIVCDLGVVVGDRKEIYVLFNVCFFENNFVLFDELNINMILLIKFFN